MVRTVHFDERWKNIFLFLQQYMAFTELQSSSCTCMLMMKAVPCVYFQSVLIHPFYYNNKLNALILVLLNKEVLFASFALHFFIIFSHWANKNTFVKKWSEFIILLFTLGTIKALMPMGLRKCLKPIIWIKHNGVKNSNWPEANHWPFLRVVKDLTNLGLATVNKSS